MIIKDSERSTKVRVAMREGPGQVIIKDICSNGIWILTNKSLLM